MRNEISLNTFIKFNTERVVNIQFTVLNFEETHQTFDELTEDVCGLGGLRLELDEVLDENMQTDVTVEESPLDVRVSDRLFAAGVAWQEDDRLGCSGTERKSSSVTDGCQGVSLGSGIGGFEVGLEDLAGGVEDLSVHGVNVSGAHVALASESDQSVAGRRDSFEVHGLVEIVDHSLDLVHQISVAWSMLHDKHDVGHLGLFI